MAQLAYRQGQTGLSQMRTTAVSFMFSQSDEHSGRLDDVSQSVSQSVIRLNDVSQSDEHCGRLNDVSQSVSQMNTVVARLDDVS